MWLFIQIYTTGMNIQFIYSMLKSVIIIFAAIHILLIPAMATASSKSTMNRQFRDDITDSGRMTGFLININFNCCNTLPYNCSNTSIYSPRFYKTIVADWINPATCYSNYQIASTKFEFQDFGNKKSCSSPCIPTSAFNFNPIFIPSTIPASPIPKPGLLTILLTYFGLQGLIAMTKTRTKIRENRRNTEIWLKFAFNS